MLSPLDFTTPNRFKSVSSLSYLVSLTVSEEDREIREISLYRTVNIWKLQPKLALGESYVYLV